MTDPQVFVTPQGRRIAYRLQAGKGPCIVFLSGYRSDMTGTKAEFLSEWCAQQGRAFLRLDYSGHGASSGLFEEGCIGDWAEDAIGLIEAVTEGAVVLVGSSMGGWISLLVARRVGRVAGLVTIAAAPDFSEEMWQKLSPPERETVMAQGLVLLPGEGGQNYVITRRFIEDGRRNFVLGSPLMLPFPVRFLQGSEDTSVEVFLAHRLFAHAEGDDMRLTIVKGADHRFSSPDCLRLIAEMVEEVADRAR